REKILRGTLNEGVADPIIGQHRKIALALGWPLTMAHEFLVGHQMALFVQAEYELRTTLAEGLGSEREIEDANSKGQPLKNPAEVALIDDGILIICRKRINGIRAYLFIEKLREAKAHAFLAGLRTPA